ncbi:MAG: NUDIX domain-containing protein [Desulfobacterales bacterium]|nr:MAG: NUDIX domain-containing protein [Desulfobacterales bacterium]
MEPAGTDEKIRVIAAVTTRNSKYLVCQRPLHKRHGGRWEFPGGKIRGGESKLEAARRELGEELRVEVREAGKLLFTALDPGSSFAIEFYAVDIEGEPQAVEHSAIRWCGLAEMTELAFAPADSKFVNEYLRKQKQ